MKLKLNKECITRKLIVKLEKPNNIPNNKPVIALLPGSRSQEIKTMLPIFLSIISDYPDYNFVIAGVNNVDPKLYNLAGYSNLYIIYIDFYYLF